MGTDNLFKAALYSDEYTLYRKLAIFIAFFVPGMTYQYFFIGANPTELFELINFLLKSFIYSLPFVLLGIFLLFLAKIIIKKPIVKQLNYFEFLNKNLNNQKLNINVFNEINKLYKQNNHLFEISISTLAVFIWFFIGLTIIPEGFWNIYFVIGFIICIYIFYTLLIKGIEFIWDIISTQLKKTIKKNKPQKK